MTFKKYDKDPVRKKKVDNRTYKERRPNSKVTNSHFKTDLGVFQRLTGAQEEFITLANENGFTDEISKQDILKLVKDNDVAKPGFILRNKSLHLGNHMFELPTFCTKEEFDDVFKTEDLLIDQLLTYKEKQVVYLRFGVIDGIKRTLQEVSKIIDISHKKLRQVEIDALEKLVGQSLPPSMNLIVNNFGMNELVITNSKEELIDTLLTDGNND